LIDRTRTFWRAGFTPASPMAFLFSGACVAIATVVRLAFGHIGLESTAFAPYYAATLIVALLCGWSAAAACATAGALCGFALFLFPEIGPPGTEVSAVISLSLYGISCAIIIIAAESHRSLVTALRAQELHRKMLSDELAHRIKNTFATVQVVIRQSITDNPALRDKVCGRIVALAVTNDRLIRSERPGSFRTLIRTELEHFGSKVTMSGPDFLCDAGTTVLLSLLFHELATNAAKYGALASPNGRLEIHWSISSGELRLDWHENGVDSMPTLRGKGFGSRLLQSAASRLNGRIEQRFEPDGLKCTLRLHIREAGPTAPLSVSAAV